MAGATQDARSELTDERRAAMARSLRRRLSGGAYDGIPVLSDLTKALSEDLRSVVADRHVVVYPFSACSPCGEQEGEFAQPIVDRAGRVNHGFARAEILLGNVGYLELRHLHPPEEGANTALAAMAFLANVDALIVDLRGNGGGEDTMDHLLVSHLFAEPTHLCTHEYRARGERVEA
ncbi:MAG: hypothetical protein JSW65_03360, partial [Candidatus Bipolaricaulota bacterium]